MSDTKQTYILAYSDYEGVMPCMEKFEGTWKELLLHLIGVGPEDEESEYPLETLKDTFDQYNGDGQPYVQVWCVEENKQVISA